VWSRIDKLQPTVWSEDYAGPTRRRHAGAGEDMETLRSDCYGLMPTADRTVTSLVKGRRHSSRLAIEFAGPNSQSRNQVGQEDDGDGAL